jgi:hypothetical protein
MSGKILTRGAVSAFVSSTFVFTAAACFAGPFSVETVNGDKMVRDTKAGVEWQQNTADANRDGAITKAPYPEGDMMNWQQARSYCQKLEFGGYKDWRLPEVNELLALVDYGCSYPSVDPIFQCEGNYYWSSTPNAENDSEAMYVHFNFGTDHWMAKDKTAFVRCLRKLKK